MNKSYQREEFRPGIWSGFFHDLSPEEMARAFATNGWTGIELSSEHAATLMERGSPNTTGKAFGAHARSLGVSFPQGHLWLGCDIIGPDSTRTVDELKQWLDLFVAIGVRAAVLHAGGAALQADGTNPERIHDMNLRALRGLAGHVEGSEIVICLENLRVTEPESVLRLAEEMRSANVGVCLDTGHMNIRGRDPAGFIRAAGPQLRALHLADNSGETDQHLAPYAAMNGVPWEQVMPALREVGYAGLLNLEVPGERHCPAGVRLLKLKYFRELLRFLWEQVG